LGDTVIEWIAIDNSDNNSTDYQTITIQDITEPSLVIPDDIAILLGDSTAPENTGWATSVDLVDANPTITYTDSETILSQSDVKTITRIWNATDFSNNTSSGIQTITIFEMIPLHITIVPDVSFGITPLAVQFTSAVIGEDNTTSYSWSINGAEFSTEQNISYTFDSIGSHMITVTVIDVDGDTSTDTIIITAYDDDNTIIITEPYEGDLIIDSNDTVIIHGGIITGTITNDGGKLSIINSTIYGDIISGDKDGVVSIDDGIINGSITINRGILYVSNSVISENIHAKNTKSVSINNSELSGSLKTANTDVLLLIQNIITDRIRVKTTDHTTIVDNIITGYVRLFDNSYLDMSKNTVSMNLHVRDSQNVIFSDNTSYGDIRLKDNQLIIINSNHAQGPFVIKENIQCSYYNNTSNDVVNIKDCDEIIN